jgi:hypothetical protein
MKSSLVLLFCGFSAWSLLGCATVKTRPSESNEEMNYHTPSVGLPHKVIKLSTRTYGDESNSVKEIKAFYLHLLETDENIKQQFEALTKELRDEYGGIFHAYDPQVIDWFPSEQSWNAPEEFKTDGNYLVIQPIGYGRGRRAGYETMIISEFHVIDCGKTIPENSIKDPNDERMSTTMKITFLGFRKLQLRPIEPSKINLPNKTCPRSK